MKRKEQQDETSSEYHFSFKKTKNKTLLNNFMHLLTDDDLLCAFNIFNFGTLSYQTSYKKKTRMKKKKKENLKK